MESLLTITIALYTFYLLVKLYISFSQIGYISKEKEKKAVLLNKNDFLTAGNYEIIKQKISIVSLFVEFGIFYFWVSFGFGYLFENLVGYSDIVFTILFVNIMITINYFVHLPIDLYEKFVVDERFGFNKSGPLLFITDTFKGAMLFYLFGSLIIGAIAYFIGSFENWWIISFVFVFGVIIIINMIYPTLIAPIFNKFTPLQDSILNEKIEELLEKVGFKSSGVFTIDASKRDTRLNAYFGGLGSTKRVVLFDTLLQKLTHGELLAVLGHELGHFKHGDIYKNIFLSGLMMFLFFALLGNLPSEIFIQMNTEKNAGVLIAFFLLIISPISFFISPVMNYFSRKNEFAADAFGSELKSADDLKRALVKLTNENKKFPKSHPLFVLFYYTHPSVLERIEKMGGMPTGAKNEFDGIEFNIYETLGMEREDGNK